MTRPFWTEDAITQTNKMVHFQDMLITGLGHCLSDLKKEQYKEFRNHLEGVFRVASLLKEATHSLLELKKGRRGKKPLWFNLGEDSLYFCLQIERAGPMLNKEIRRNEWTVICARLKEARRQCLEIQERILGAMPREFHPEGAYVSEQSVMDWRSLLETLKMGETAFNESGGGRWTRRGK